MIDYKKQEFEEVLRGYEAVLGTVRGDAIEKSLRILKPNSTVVSLTDHRTPRSLASAA